jgi:uncharacterized phiE125 gp8 family phage protein
MLHAAWKRTVDAVLEPVTVADAQQHLRVTSTDEQAWIARAVKAARQQIEEYVHFGLLTQTWQYVQAGFTPEIVLPMAGPLQSATVQYYDAAGALQTASSSLYDVDTVTEPGRLVLKPDQVWPQTQAGRANAVLVTYLVGQTSVQNVRADIVSALLLLVGDQYEHREQTVVGTIAATLPRGVEALLAPLRIWWRAPCGAEDL